MSAIKGDLSKIAGPLLANQGEAGCVVIVVPRLVAPKPAACAPMPNQSA